MSSLFAESGRLRRRAGDFASAREGAIAVMFALMVGALAGVMSLVYDLGRAWNLDTELQNAVDAAALVGATQLDGEEGARLRAVQAARSELAANIQKFADISGAGTIVYDDDVGCTSAADCANKAVSNENFEFYRSLNPKEVAMTDGEATFIEVKVARTLRIVFGIAVGAPGSASPFARAIAGYETYLCGTVPLMMCNPQEPANNEDLAAPFDYTPYVGSGVTLKELGKGAQLIPGGFAWLAPVSCDSTIPDDPATEENESCTIKKGASELGPFLAAVNPPQICLGNNLVIQTGDIASAQKWINMRLDVYPSNSDEDSDYDYQPSPNFLTGLVPDTSGFPVDGGGNPILPANLDDCDFSVTSGNPGGVGALKKPDNQYLGPWMWDSAAGDWAASVTPPDHMGYPRDDCAYLTQAGTAPSPNCIFSPPPSSGITPGTQAGDGLWAFEAYMRMQHPNVVVPVTFDPTNCGAGECYLPSNDSGTAGLNSGVPADLNGDGKLSRWELYNWENLDENLDGAPDNLPDSIENGMAAYNRPRCFGSPSDSIPDNPFVLGTTPDRRLVGVAVANCNAIEEAGGGIGKNEKKPLPLASQTPAVNMFLTEAVGELDPQSFYGELVGPEANVGQSAIEVFDRIVLYE